MKIFSLFRLVLLITTFTIYGCGQENTETNTDDAVTGSISPTGTISITMAEFTMAESALIVDGVITSSNDNYTLELLLDTGDSVPLSLFHTTCDDYQPAGWCSNAGEYEISCEFASSTLAIECEIPNSSSPRTTDLASVNGLFSRVFELTLTACLVSNDDCDSETTQVNF